MHPPIYVYDPTVSDPLSKVRGIGRYLQILREQFKDEWVFTNNTASIPSNCIFLNPFFSILKKPLLIRRRAKKQIAIIHDIIPLKYPAHYPSGMKGNIFSLLNALTLKNYDVIITDSLHSKRDIISYLRVDEKKVKVIYPTLPNMFLNSKFRILYSSFQKDYCIYVGDATWNKNLVSLAKAIKLADVPCVFIGKVFEPFAPSNTESDFFRVSQLSEQASSEEPLDMRGTTRNERSHSNVGMRVDLTKKKLLPVFSHPWQQELHAFAQEIKDDSHFIFPGYVPDEDLLGYYAHAKLNILVSRDEGFGFSFLEASSQKCPTLLSNIPIFREISQNAAFFCDGENPQDIAEKIKRLYGDEKLRNNLVLRSQKRLDFFTKPGRFKKEVLDAINNS